MTPLGSNRDRHAVLGEGELGEKRLRGVPVRAPVREAAVRARDGPDGGAPSADDVALAFKLRKRGEASRRRAAAAKRSRGAKAVGRGS